MRINTMKILAVISLICSSLPLLASENTISHSPGISKEDKAKKHNKSEFQRREKERRQLDKLKKLCGIDKKTPLHKTLLEVAKVCQDLHRRDIELRRKINLIHYQRNLKEDGEHYRSAIEFLTQQYDEKID